MTSSFDPDTRIADEQAMRLALDQALNAQLAGEVPVGAVILQGGKVLATGYNRPITTHDPTAHAEIVALRHAAQLVENYRLPDCEIFVTLEPCAMCAMALMHARFKRVVFAATDPKTGAAGSVVNLFDSPQLNHHTDLVGGVLADPASSLLKQFFADRRAQQRAEKLAKQAGGADGDTALGEPIAIEPAPPMDDDSAAPIPTGDAIELPAEDSPVDNGSPTTQPTTHPTTSPIQPTK